MREMSVNAIQSSRDHERTSETSSVGGTYVILVLSNLDLFPLLSQKEGHLEVDLGCVSIDLQESIYSIAHESRYNGQES